MVIRRQPSAPEQLDQRDPVNLAALIRPPAWWADALCREPAYADVNFHPARGQGPNPALEVCRRCLAVDACLADAYTDLRGLLGIRGGTSHRQRIATARRDEADQ